jgi:hypothetical protein
LSVPDDSLLLPHLLFPGVCLFHKIFNFFHIGFPTMLDRFRFLVVLGSIFPSVWVSHKIISCFTTALPQCLSIPEEFQLLPHLF